MWWSKRIAQRYHVYNYGEEIWDTKYYGGVPDLSDWGKEDGVQVVYRDESIWCTQKAMTQLFDVGVPAISKHLKNIFETRELIEDMVVSKMEKTTKLGNLQYEKDGIRR